MESLRRFATSIFAAENVPLVLPLVLLVFEACWWHSWGPSVDGASAGSRPLLIAYVSVATKILYSISSLVITGSLCAILIRYQKWIRSSRYADRYYEPLKSSLLITSGAGLALLPMLASAWTATIWSLVLQMTVWLFLCSAAFELKPGRITILLGEASRYRRRSLKELAILAYSRRFGGAVIGVLCAETGAWLLYLITHESVSNYREAIAAFSIATLGMYFLVYGPAFWGGRFLLKGKDN